MKTLARLAALTIVLLVAASPATASADAGDMQIVIGTPTDGGVYPQGATVQFAFACISTTVAIVSCDGSQPLGSDIDTFHAGTHTLSVTATDYLGETATASVTYTVFDWTPPHVDFRVPGDGATYDQGSSLTYDYDCADDPGGLGIQACIAQNGMPPGAPLDTSRLGTFTFDVFAVDLANNIGHQSVTYTIVDRTPPVITLTSPVDGATYMLGQQVWVSFSCSDGQGSGMNGCKGDQPSGSLLDTSTFGTHAFTVTAFDRAGNVSHATSTYFVAYGFSGFFSPAAAYPTAASVKAGQGVPLKFSLNGNQGLDVVAAAASAPCGSDDQTSANGTLTYNASNDRYTYLLSSAKAWAGTCRDLVLTLSDGTTHRARFTFTK
jgi:hypothetical protein